MKNIWKMMKYTWKLKELNVLANTNFGGDKVPKEDVYHTCISCASIDSVMKMEKNNCSQVYLEECKYKIKKKKMSEFINVKLESDSSSDSDCIFLLAVMPLTFIQRGNCIFYGNCIWCRDYPMRGRLYPVKFICPLLVLNMLVHSYMCWKSLALSVWLQKLLPSAI